MLERQLGEVRLTGQKPLASLGQSGERYFCIKTEPNRSQVKLEFEKRGMSCVNTWGSPPGIYPGVDECGPDGKPVGCEPPAPPKEMAGGSLHQGPHHRHLGAGKNCCRVPGTENRPCFDYNPTTKRCGFSWMDTSNAEYPECVPAPGGYGGAYMQPGASSATPGSAADQDCPIGQFRPGPGQRCRGSVGAQPNMGRARMGQQGWLPPSCGPGQQAPTPVVGGCDLPAGYGPLPTGGAAIGKAVMACQGPDGTFTVYPYPEGAALASGVTQDCLNQFGDVTMLRQDDPRCGGQQASIISTPTPTPSDTPVSATPPAQETPTELPVSGAPPTVNTQPSYESGPPVLPPHQNFTTSAMPTGAWPGAPFSAMPPVQQPMKAIAPVPRPEACPLGPVPVADWANKCALSKLNRNG